LGRSPSMKKIFMLIRRAAPHDSPVLILGESGCGKELAAREIHRLSSRSRGPLVPVSCANINRDIQESEFFGHERGAFTGADRKRIGLFETAAGGTIFLDEIAECAPATQAALLRVLQEGEIRPAGSSVPIKIDVRVIAATNVDLEKAAAAGTFRSDLYYRLSRLVIGMPPLRERPQDIVMLAERILEKTCERLRRPDRQYSPRALEMLLSYRWPGNVRELENLSEKVALFTPRPIVRPVDLQELDGWDWSKAATVATLDEMERRHIKEVLAMTEGNYKQAAILLGIPRSTLYRKVRRFDLAPAPGARGTPRLLTSPRLPRANL
ncbi:MAG TPA: sigma-54 dependent transcriptional regulator, partial [Verrucomicrobiae bacterium]|nr:sigma-54 dependent transcriptional regulator [Verrucomicrobiae bacterium]